MKSKYNVYKISNEEDVSYLIITNKKDSSGEYEMFSDDGVNFNFFSNEEAFFRNAKRQFIKGFNNLEEAKRCMNEKFLDGLDMDDEDIE